MVEAEAAMRAAQAAGQIRKPRKGGLQRFAHQRPAMKPGEVEALPAGHPAMTENRPRFTHMMVRAADSPRLLVSGMNSRKLGRMVTKGPWRGFPIFSLTLPERTTCPRSCHIFASCYGNAMHLARRHLPGPDLERALVYEVCRVAREHPRGFVVRLHSLGDFYSLDYVRTWEALLYCTPALHIFGFTACLPDAVDCGERRIGEALAALKLAYPDRFRIRWSRADSVPDGATVIGFEPTKPRVAQGVVCPAETGATQCCGTCGLCWINAFRKETVVFILHGRKGGPQG